MSAMSFLFSELVQYSQARSARSIVELERRLEDVGYEVEAFHVFFKKKV